MLRGNAGGFGEAFGTGGFLGARAFSVADGESRP